MGLRRKSRELALQFLFGYDFQGHSHVPEEVEKWLGIFCQVFDAGEKSMDYSRQLIFGIFKNQEAIDDLIRANSHNWRLERISCVDRNLLRIAVYEMQFSQDVPSQVAINEALEIAKRYSVNDSVGFINGVLDSIQKKV